MNPITRASDEGYSEDEIVNFLSNAYPKLRNKISSALKTGYSAKEIINFVSNLIGEPKQKSKSAQGMSQQSVHALKTIEDESKQQQLVNTGLSLGAGALAGKALSNVAPKLGNMFGKMGGVFGSPKQIAEAPVAQAFGSSAQIPKVPPTPPTAIVPPPVPFDRGKEIIEKTGLGEKIKKVIGKGSTQSIPGMLDKIVSAEQKALIEKESGMPLAKAITRYADDVIKEESSLSIDSIRKQGEKIGAPETEVPELAFEQQKSQIGKRNETETSKLVALPDGQVGTLVEERQGIGTVELPDGKKRTQKISELGREPPEITEEVIRAVEDLLKIPEEAKSAPLSTTAYEPASKRMIIRFHNGETVEYDDVDEDVFEAITQGKHTPKTEGGNVYGTFSPTDPHKSRGASFSALIRSNPKYSKANEGKTWRTLRKGYAYWEGLEKKPKKRKKTP